jgi:hypothetical protein
MVGESIVKGADRTPFRMCGMGQLAGLRGLAD